ncbi:ankyrin repeat domain-containing protein [Massilia litorea]|uniref:Ankyrin repeat domain-containing protein n=1 Tax=Massilia litorea TaxID=2769491 RepID=A0A7L9U257_9BURK|nr:ankyrin repeat domain-containing protein [Massilia litorea]QOL49123.1 ankyrin repeat domain-containing protein [Massilia litorea]
MDKVDIFSAVERKNLRELKRILKSDPLAARRTDCWGRTALMLSCIEGEEAFVRLLLPCSDAMAADRDGETALMLASFGHPGCVELLLPVSEPMARDGDGWTALMWAASSGSERCVALLLPHSDANAATESGLTALDIARTYDQQARAQQIRRHMVETGDTGALDAVAVAAAASGSPGSAAPV